LLANRKINNERTGVREGKEGRGVGCGKGSVAMEVNGKFELFMITVC
jgi:hypothetical protein